MGCGEKEERQLNFLCLTTVKFLDRSLILYYLINTILLTRDCRYTLQNARKIIAFGEIPSVRHIYISYGQAEHKRKSSKFHRTQNTPIFQKNNSYGKKNSTFFFPFDFYVFIYLFVTPNKKKRNFICLTISKSWKIIFPLKMLFIPFTLYIYNVACFFNDVSFNIFYYSTFFLLRKVINPRGENLK